MRRRRRSITIILHPGQSVRVKCRRRRRRRDDF